MRLDFDDIDPDDVLAFLDHRMVDRKNGASTRNARLAAIHAFARHAAAGHPEHLERCQRILALPFKRAQTRVVEYLEADEVRALLYAPDRTDADGRRDRALLLLMFNTGVRVQEIVDLRPCDLHLERPLQVRLQGKGRKERICPLWPLTANVLREFMIEHAVDPVTAAPLLRNHRGEPLARFGVRYLMHKYVQVARSRVPSIAAKRVHPHTMRHTAAVHLLQAGVDLVTTSHWLGHASVETTNQYAAVDLETKRAALARAQPLAETDTGLASWRKDASIVTWLEAL